jgi:hypothetical protein
VLRVARMLSVVCVIAVVACGCGGSGDTVARVGHIAITEVALDHWMHVALGEDYLALSGRAAPAALLAPPSGSSASPACVAYLQRIAPKRSGGQRTVMAVQLANRCRQLYLAIREQALRSLIYSAWDEGQAAEQHVSASEAEVRSALARSRAEQDSARTSLADYLDERHLSLSDAMTLARDGLLQRKVQAKLQRYVIGRLSGVELAKLLQVYEAEWTEKTDCRPGYVIYRCAQYKGREGLLGPSPNSLLAPIVRWQGDGSGGSTAAHVAAPDLNCKEAKGHPLCEKVRDAPGTPQ